MPSIEDIKKEYDELQTKLGDPGLISDWQKFEELSKRKKILEKMVDKQKEIEEIKKQIEENKAIIRGKESEDLTTLAESETIQLQERGKKLEEELKEMMGEGKPSSGFDSAIIEIRAGTGGEEAALFAGDLYKMYSKYAVLQNWQQKVLDSHPSELKGFKEIIFEIKGGSAFDKMKYEAGVHRVQRIPATEKAGRVHTSTATVAVLPKPKTAQIKIRPDEIKVDYFRSSGPGGQNVQKRETAVRITHLKTGLSVASQTERNQLQNKENAMAILAARLLEKENEEILSKTAGKRNTQIGGAKRAEKIRTYNFPQDRLTDHRIKKSWHNLEEIMEGKLDKMIETLLKSEGN